MSDRGVMGGVLRRSSFRLRMIERACPRTAGELHRFVKRGLGLDVPRRAVVAGSVSPFEYLRRSFFGDELAGAERAESGDLVVWANRGGGKTRLGAVATLVDLLFKPGIQMRILGGSLEQSQRMHEHLLQLLETPLLADRRVGAGGSVLAKPATGRGVTLMNGSRVELLAQSHRSVRGTRVHKLRCDEVEEFVPEVWQAAQLVTRSGRCGRWKVHGSVHALSTAHRIGGLMSTLTGMHETPGENAGRSGRLLRWTALDVAERCPASRDCASCALWEDCGGVAKGSRGFVSIDDLLVQRGRASVATWRAEMLCERPTREDAVYPMFDPALHVRAVGALSEDAVLVGGMDFGLRSPTVYLWAVVGECEGREVVHVVDELVARDRTLGANVDAVLARGWPLASWVSVDPAGLARNAQTGRSDVEMLRERGLRVRTRRHRVRDGIERVRSWLDHGRLLVDPRCERLIHSLQAYHFDRRSDASEEPAKDGPDHAVDALRYLIVNLDLGQRSVSVVGY
ncbi:MAG: hypothetical protein RIG82_08430 [Phycisphaeraceae bacterium]